MADDTKPNIVVIWGDDIGMTNLSCYSHGIMGYRTANIDRIANEGMLFTDWYGEQSCTAGRSAFIMGQSVFRTGLSKVGIPGSPVGMRPEDPTIARLLKAKGYATGQFGKNHLGDKDEHLPTMHGFDEFFGNLYHLNAEEEPELPDYPPAADFPHFRERFGPRGVLHSWANGEGTQRVEDTGPLSKKRMETIDDEVADAASEFIRRQHGAGTPFFAWVNTTHMHFRTHPKPESIGQAGRWQSPYHDTMIDHDRTVGSLLDLLDELGIANDTFVMYSTDNGPHMNSWPDASMTPFRNEKNSNWEGAFRVPCVMRWPGRIPAGVVVNDICSHLDMLPTLLAVAGEADIKKKLCRATKPAGTPTRCTSTGTTWSPSSRWRANAVPDKGSSTSPTTAIWSPCGSTTGRRCLWSKGSQARCRSGPSRSSRCGYRSSTTCAPIRSNAPTSRPTPTTTGSLTGPTSPWSPRVPSPASSWPRSRTSRPARRRRRSPSTRRWRS
jgi:arylsulfatase A-like enzyme